MSSKFSENILQINAVLSVDYGDYVFAENPEKFLGQAPKMPPQAVKSSLWLGLVLFQVKADNRVLITPGPIPIWE